MPATLESVPHPYLLFCPFLPVNEPILFADWELGPVRSFEDRWVDAKFKAQAIALLSKFVGPDHKPIANPALLCRKGKQLDGQKPCPNEYRALELSLAFAFVDRNPRYGDEERNQTWRCVTADNAELYAWPIDVGQGHVTLSTGFLLRTSTGGYKISDPEVVLRPPLDLQMPGQATADPLVLTGVYETVLKSLRSPGANPTADGVRVAVTWFAKAWRNTATVHAPERLVYLKTAFEALTGTSKPHCSAQSLRKTFEALPSTTEEDSEALVWSPAEKCETRHWVGRGGNPCSGPKTDLETWFMEFHTVRNAIIHDGELGQAEFRYPRPNSVYKPVARRTTYHGPFFFTAEFLLRGVIKALLSAKLGYEDAWRTGGWRAFKALYNEVLTSTQRLNQEE